MPYKFSMFLLTVLKVALLKEAAAKKDAEISSLQIFKERYESGAGVDKFKSRSTKPTARVRASSDVSAHKSRTTQNDVGSGPVEVRSEICHEFRKLYRRGIRIQFVVDISS